MQKLVAVCALPASSPHTPYPTSNDSAEMEENMNISCNIIKDLLPSYIDQICSDESRHAVDEHISTCQTCKAYLETMKKELTAEENEPKQLQYMKKVKRHYQLNIFAIGIFLFICTVGTVAVITRIGRIPIRMYNIILPVFIVAAYAFLPKDSFTQKKTKQSAVFIILSLFVTAATISLLPQSLNWINSGHTPFNMPVNKLGPFMTKCLAALAIAQTAILIISVIQKYRDYQIKREIYAFTLTGISISLAYITMLYHMTTPENYARNVSASLSSLFAEGIATAVIIDLIKLITSRFFHI